MSIVLITQVYNERSVNGRLQRVLVCLCDMANDDGVCWPSIGRIAWKLECSEDTVRRAIKELEDLGVVSIEYRNGHSSIYTINLSVLPRKAAYVPEPPRKMLPPGKMQEGTPPQNATPTPPQNATPTPPQNATPTPPQNATQNRKSEPSVEPSLAEQNAQPEKLTVVPESTPHKQAVAMVQAWAEHANGGRWPVAKTKAIAQAKELVDAGFKADDIPSMLGWARDDDFWGDKDLDFGALLKIADKWSTSQQKSKKEPKFMDYVAQRHYQQNEPELHRYYRDKAAGTLPDLSTKGTAW